MRFDVHWCEISPPWRDEGVKVDFNLAIWPAPVNPDVCFQAAGFTDFGDADAAWDDNAEAMLSRSVQYLSTLGVPQLISPPLMPRAPWYRQWMTPAQPLPLLEQLSHPMWEDSLPACTVSFGNRAWLQTGHGHRILWMAISRDQPDQLASLVSAVAGPHPVFRTELRWASLRQAHTG